MIKRAMFVIGLLSLSILTACQQQSSFSNQSSQSMQIKNSSSQSQIKNDAEKLTMPKSSLSLYNNIKLGFSMNIPSDSELSEYESSIEIMKRLSDETCLKYEGLSCLINLSVSMGIYPNIDEYFKSRGALTINDFQKEPLPNISTAYIRIGSRLEQGERSETNTEQKKIIFENAVNGENRVYEINLEWPKSIENMDEVKSILDEFNRSIDSFTFVSD